MAANLETAIEGSPRTRFLLELLGNSAIFPIANGLFELLIDRNRVFLQTPDFYALVVAALAQAAVLSGWRSPRRFLPGNLVGPAIYVGAEAAMEGVQVLALPHHVAYWAFGLVIGLLQQVRQGAGPRAASVLIVVENVVRSSILLAMYAIFEVLTAPPAARPARDFFEDPSHLFIFWAILLLGVVAGISAAMGQRFLGMLRDVSRRLRVYSEWFFGRPLLEQALEDPSRLALARRERAVVFMDIRGFTAWSELYAPEWVVDTLNDYYLEAESVFERHPPVRSKFNADEVMAVFESADEAVAAARELCAGASRVLAPHGLGAGVGAHWGRVIEGVVGASGIKSYDVLGDTVNTAKRIEGVAAGGEVLLSAELLARTRLERPAQRSIEVKGKSAPLTVFAVPLPSGSS